MKNSSMREEFSYKQKYVTLIDQNLFLSFTINILDLLLETEELSNKAVVNVWASKALYSYLNEKKLITQLPNDINAELKRNDKYQITYCSFLDKCGIELCISLGQEKRFSSGILFPYNCLVENDFDQYKSDFELDEECKED
ncbi:hypothetical protein [Brevibacillus agri]|uniref:hypothetical protein n=1 Tax=Brevibacillus agri TaxID=51101 RepID=UPI0025B710CF|nr:hypothetical protein [Brevibacillus agri]MDN4096220.1 hypothetical protein [Brevibacillus agri]MED3501644.1 hypothetical protein [Brevibacillus agri]